jgi:DNA-binding transcriptional ArsR family regulator
MAKYRIDNFYELMQVTRALSDENRVRILMFLSRGELCLCQIIEMLGLSPSTVSKHVAVLRQAGLVEGRKEGRWHYYRLPEPTRSHVIGGAIRWLSDALASDPTIERDVETLKSVILKEREELCAHYKS